MLSLKSIFLSVFYIQDVTVRQDSESSNTLENILRSEFNPSPLYTQPIFEILTLVTLNSLKEAMR